MGSGVSKVGISAPTRCRPGRRGRRAAARGASSRDTAAAAARTSQALTDSRSRLAACSTSALSCSGRRRLMRAVAASSASGAAAGGSASRRRLVGRGGGDDEAGLARAQAQLDRAGRELARDLVGGGRQRVQQHQPDRRLERGAQAVGQRAGLIAARFGGDGELAAEVLDIRGQVHGTSVASLWHHVKSRWHHRDATTARAARIPLRSAPSISPAHAPAVCSPAKCRRPAGAASSASSPGSARSPAVL